MQVPQNVAPVGVGNGDADMVVDFPLDEQLNETIDLTTDEEVGAKSSPFHPFLTMYLTGRGCTGRAPGEERSRRADPGHAGSGRDGAGGPGRIRG